MTDFPCDWFGAQFEYEMSASEFSTAQFLESLTCCIKGDKDGVKGFDRGCSGSKARMVEEK